MRRAILLSLFSTATACFGSVVYFSDPTAFLSAAHQIPNTTTELETFNGPGLSVPNLSFQDYSDFVVHAAVNITNIENGVLNGCVGHSCVSDTGAAADVTTVWTFAKPIFAFGATFQYLNRDQIQTNGIQGLPYVDGFSGFISDTPLSSLLFQVSDAVVVPPSRCPLPCFPPSTEYTMDNLYLQVDPASGSETPEPATLGLITLSLIFLGLLPRKIFAKA